MNLEYRKFDIFLRSAGSVCDTSDAFLTLTHRISTFQIGMASGLSIAASKIITVDIHWR